MHPQIQWNPLSVLIAVVASFVFGFLWHGPIFGKLWMKLQKMPADMKPDSKMMIRSMLLNVLATALTAYVLVFATNVWRISVWVPGSADDHWAMYGFMSGFFTWLGYYVPLFLGSTAWENRSWQLFAYSTTYYFLNLQLMAMIVSYTYGM